ncbi:MAG: hypothetical protein RSF88_09065 [Lachnospiraceae bacterium]
MAEWGSVLSENLTDTQAKDAIYAEGKTTTIASKDVEQAKKFYMISGLEEQDAEEQAVKYVFEREALYQEAIKNGYAVTEEEVWDYLEELKEVLKGVDNSADVMAVMSQFDSEEDYWNYEFKVYQKNLPIQNYVHDLEQTYKETSTYSDDASGGEEAWQQYFEQMKSDLVSNENYQIVE